MALPYISRGCEREIEGPQEAPRGETMQLITFSLGEEEYGVDIMAVREIKVWTETTPLPNTPAYVRGVINLRGLIVPIFDLRARFGLGLTETTKTHVVIIVAVDSRTVGILVDAVSDIVTVSSGDIRPVPETEYGREHLFLRGLVTVDQQMVALIAPEKLFLPSMAAVAREALPSPGDGENAEE